MITGTRTQVAETRRSGSPRILRDSLRTLSSSLLQPSSFSDPAHGTTFIASGAGNGPSVTDDAAQVTGAVAGVRRGRDLRVLLAQRVDAVLTGTGRRLVRRDDELFETVLAVQRTHRHDHRQRRAVRVADDPLRTHAAPPAALTSGTTSGTSGSIRNAPELSTATAPRAAATGAHSRGHLVGHVEHRDVDAVEDLGRERLHDDVLAAHLQHLAGRARRGDQPDLAPDVLARAEDVEHHRADGAGGTDDGKSGLAHRPVPP